MPSARSIDINDELWPKSSYLYQICPQYGEESCSLKGFRWG